jgi:hypothetical protein
VHVNILARLSHTYTTKILASLMSAAVSHGYSAHVVRWYICHFLGGKRISDHCWPYSLLGMIRLTLCQMAHRLHTVMDDDDEKLHELGSTV